MTVTFAPEFVPELDIAGFAINCACSEVTTGIIAATYPAALALLDEGSALECGDILCAVTPPAVEMVYVDEPPTVNVSNANARLILDTLGLLHCDDAAAELGSDSDMDLCGQECVEDFYGRLLLALAVAPADPGIPSHNLGPRWVEGGRRPGYLQDRLRDLTGVADYARRHARAITWA